MRHLLVGLWKEARDQRAIVIALLVALPVLVFAAGWAFGDQIAPANFASAILFVVPTALALFLIAIASELFGSERRRGTLDFARRLPRGLRTSFVAKLAAYVTGSVLFAAWGWCVAYVTCLLFGPEQAPSDLLRLTVDQPDFVASGFCLLLLGLGFWILLVSTWIPQGGAAVLGAALLLGLIALPAVLELKESPWLANELTPRTLGALGLPLAVLAGVPLLALALSYLRGNRFLSSAWAPAWRGLALVAVFSGGGHALGASALARARTIDPYDPEFRIAGGCVGVGGRYAYVNVRRGSVAWSASSLSREFMGTPHQPWIIDLETGAHRRAGDFDDGWSELLESRYALQPIVWRMNPSVAGVAWLDAATGTERKVLPYGVRTPEILAWEREALASLCWNHDAQGRGVWFEGDTLVREGDPLPEEARYREREIATSYKLPIPGGWVRPYWKANTPHSHKVTIEAATGQVRTVSHDTEQLLGTYLSPTLFLSRQLEPFSPRMGPWRLLDHDASDSARILEAPPGVEYISAVLRDGRALVMTGEPAGAKRLVLWAPRTGEVTPVLDAQGQPVLGLGLNVNAQIPGDVLLISVTREVGSAPPWDLLLMDGNTNRARRLPSRAHHVQVLAIVDARTVIVVENGSQVVRFGPEDGQRDVLFPRERK